MPKTAFCHKSCPSHSAMETLNSLATRLLTLLTSPRFSFNDRLWAKYSVSCRTPTTMRPRRPRALHQAQGRTPPPSDRSLGLLRAHLESPLHALFLKGLDSIPRLHVLIVLQRHPALVPSRHLADIFLEPAKAPHLAAVHDHVVADEPRLRAAGQLAFGHVAARDAARTPDREDLPHLGLSDDPLLIRGLEHPFQ